MEDLELLEKIDFNWVYEEKNQCLKIRIMEADELIGMYYACYLMFDNEILQRHHYQLSKDFYFDLDKTGVYSVKIYIFDKKNNVKQSKLFPLGFVFVYSGYYIKFNANYINNNTLRYGEKFVEQSLLEFNGFDAAEVKNIEAVWTQDPYNNRTWRWHLLQMTIINYLIAYFQNNKDSELFIKRINELLTSFLKYKVKGASDPMLWHDHGTAIRLSNLCFLMMFSLREKLISFNDSIYKIIMQLIVEHIEKLSEQSFYSQYTNHGFDQSLILYQVCLELENIVHVKKYIQLAVDRINSEIDHAFCADGGHKENSPAYLNFGIKQCLAALNTEKAYHDEVKSFGHVNEVVDRATMALLHATKPNGELPLIGDTSRFITKNSFIDYYPKHYQEFIYSVKKGKEGKRPESNFHVLPETGYVFARSDWSEEGFSDAIFFTLKASYHSNYHRHDDDLSMTLYGHGEDWLVDGGIYKYDNKDPHRRYIRSYLSHNLTAPNGLIANRKHPNPASTGISDWSFVKNKLTVNAFSKMFSDVESSRIITFDYDTNKLKVVDKLSCDSETEFTSRFFVDEDKTITIKDKKIYIYGKQKALVIEVASEIHHEIVLIEVDSLDRKVIGKLSKVNNKLYQVFPIEIRFSSCKSLECAFDMYFVDESHK